MARTEKQSKGDMCEEEAKFSDKCWGNYEIEESSSSNNEGYDYKRIKGRNLFKSEDDGEW